LHKSRALRILSAIIEVDYVAGNVHSTHLGIHTALLKCNKLLTVDLLTRQRKVVLLTFLLAVVGLLCQYKIIFGYIGHVHGHEKILTRRIGITV